MDIKRIVKKYIVEIIILIIILIILFGLIVLIFLISGRSKKKNLFMCYFYPDKTKNDISQKVYDNANKYAPEYNLQIYDDKEMIQFFKDHYNDSDRYLNKFNELQGPHKADLWRYCVLYHYGGVYLDIKTELIKPLNEIFIDDNILYTVLSINSGTICIGSISTPPKNPIFLDLIENILNIGDNFDYLDFCKDFYDKINEYCNGIKPGFNRNFKNDIDIYLFTEGCSKNKENTNIMKSNLWNIDENQINKKECKSVDKYGLCCYVYDNETPIIKTRFDDFGKTW